MCVMLEYLGVCAYVVCACMCTFSQITNVILVVSVEDVYILYVYVPVCVSVCLILLI